MSETTPKKKNKPTKPKVLKTLTVVLTETQVKVDNGSLSNVEIIGIAELLKNNALNNYKPTNPQ